MSLVAEPLKQVVAKPRESLGRALVGALQRGLNRGWQTWFQFWFRPESTVSMEILRAGIGLSAFLAYVAIWHSVVELYGEGGWVSREAIQGYIDNPYVHSIFYYITNNTGLVCCYYLFLASCLALTCGCATRVVKWIVWVGHTSFLYRNPHVLYGFDNLLSSMLFIVCLAPIGSQLSVDARLRRYRGKSARPTHSRWGNACLRLCQFQIVIVFFFSGTEKLRGASWWSGDAVWHAVTNFEYFGMMPLGFLAEHYWLVNLMTYGTLLLELSYPYLIWGKARAYYLIAAILLHVGIGVTMHLYVFALLSIVCHLAFLRPQWVRTIFTDAS